MTTVKLLKKHYKVDMKKSKMVFTESIVLLTVCMHGPTSNRKCY